MSVILDKIKLLPDKPGVYVMLDHSGTIIYVGKAKNLKNRVRQYFFNTVKTEKVMAMCKCIADFYYIITPSEIDALSLENNLIKKHKPRYNILLKDDKTYPYIKIDLKEEFPTFRITRKILKDGAKYFGPFMAGVSVNSVLEIINLAFLVRPCQAKIKCSKNQKPCLNYHINKCKAPCANLISKQEYLEGVKKAIDFLSGETKETEKLLRQKMMALAQSENFELALKYKEKLDSIDKIKLKRLTALNKFLNADVISSATNGIYTAVNVLFVRNGRMLGGKNFAFENASEGADALSEFMSRYYKKGVDVPEEIILGEEIIDAEVLANFIQKESQTKPQILCARQGVRRQLVLMAEANAVEHLETAITKIAHKTDMTINACKRLQTLLGLRNYPKRMECYDISNISGVDKVGSMVVFTDGVADKTEYRRFKIKSFEGADDFRSLQEMLSRRFERLNNNDEKFTKPDLIIIDGGKGQLSSVKQVFDELGVLDIDLISLAEKNEEVFMPDKENSIALDKSDYALRLLVRIRDEAHRFAITYFRSLHGKRSLSSVLDGVRGLGKVKRKALIDKFKDLGGIISATKEQLLQVDGIGDKQAQLIIEQLTKEGLR